MEWKRFELKFSFHENSSNSLAYSYWKVQRMEKQKIENLSSCSIGENLSSVVILQRPEVFHQQIASLVPDLPQLGQLSGWNLNRLRCHHPRHCLVTHWCCQWSLVREILEVSVLNEIAKGEQIASFEIQASSLDHVRRELYEWIVGCTERVVELW